MIKITPEECDFVCKYVHDISGISLDNSKSYLLETRLGGLVKEEGCSSFFDLCHKARVDPGRSIEQEIIDRITTAETLFFRDIQPFQLLQHKILPDLIDARTAQSSGFFPTPIRIWSAACATGQEVYSIAMVLRELLPDIIKYDIKLLGTDISNRAVARASCGEYNKFEIDRGLPGELLGKYFAADGKVWKVKDEIRAMVSFKKLNLLNSLDGLGKFDIVLCRNVGVYFNPDDRKKLFDGIAGVLEHDGYLIIGSTESLTNVYPRFEPKRYLKSIFYQLKL